MMKSRSFANRALEMAMRSMMGATCCAKERGWASHNHSLALNLETTSHSHNAAPPHTEFVTIVSSVGVTSESWS